MRDVLVSLLLLGLLPACFRRPYIGLLVFSWLAYMRLQDLTWGFARGIRWSYYVAILMLVGYMLKPKERWFLVEVRSLIMVGLVLVIGMGLIASSPTAEIFTRYIEYIKIVGIALFTTSVVKNREHLRILMWVISLSLGFYGVKTGLWVVVTGGGKVLQGPGGMLADNNDFAMAMAMSVPLLFQIGMTEKREIIRRAFLFSVPMTVIAVGATYSRGGFLSVGLAIGILVWRSRNRVVGILIGVLIAIVAVLSMPDSYKERLATLRNPQEEGSAAGRLRAWGVATNMAKDNPFFGVGFGQFRQNWLKYCADPTPQEKVGKAVIVAHSSYFQIWAECGTPALILYLSMLGLSFLSIWRTRRMAKTRYFSSWILSYATMFEASLAAFVVGSAFLNRAHFDLLYHMVAVILMFEHIAKQEMTNKVVYPEKTGARGVLQAAPAAGFGPQPAFARQGFRDPALRQGGF
ncbi:MAG: putative O-glycosylation ligase, exosortase A system-associated [Planctomycetota bacterium]